MNLNYQNARQTERPREMVENIGVGIPSFIYVENPTEDGAFMARIGAKLIHTIGGPEYEMTNAVSGTRFAFQWYPEVGLFYS